MTNRRTLMQAVAAFAAGICARAARADAAPHSDCLEDMLEEVSGGLMIRKMPCMKHRNADGTFTSGVIVKHAHKFDHTSILIRGSMIGRSWTPDGVERPVQVYHAPAHIFIKAEIAHEFTATEEDTVVWCVYEHRTPDGKISETPTNWPDAYADRNYGKLR